MANRWCKFIDRIIFAFKTISDWQTISRKSYRKTTTGRPVLLYTIVFRRSVSPVCNTVLLSILMVDPHVVFWKIIQPQQFIDIGSFASSKDKYYRN